METNSTESSIRDRIVDVLNILQGISLDLPLAVDNTADPADSHLPAYEDDLDTVIEILVNRFDIDPVEYINADRPS